MKADSGEENVIKAFSTGKHDEIASNIFANMKEIMYNLLL